VRLPDGVDQREAMQSMLDRGVATRRGIMCIHREKPYAETVRFPLPISEDAQDRTILLPLYPQMTEAEQDQVIGALQEALRHRTAGGSSSSARRPHAHKQSEERGGSASN
jgi:dTDP-4-amino-4,6-dideoxygalactose transaminase